jgi:hypothetical protein
MKARLIAITALASVSLNLNAQKLNYTPDLVAGHRSYTYMHNVNYYFNDRLKLNNLTLFDTEYTRDKENIFFIRNTLAYHLTRKISINAALGMKNPGAFFSVYIQYRIAKPIYTLSYSIGTTYQKDFRLSNPFLLNICHTSKKIFRDISVFSLLAIWMGAAIPEDCSLFGWGVKQDKMMYGIASNFDQFNNGKKTLENIGAFVKYNF